MLLLVAAAAPAVVTPLSAALVRRTPPNTSQRPCVPADNSGEWVGVCTAQATRQGSCRERGNTDCRMHVRARMEGGEHGHLQRNGGGTSAASAHGVGSTAEDFTTANNASSNPGHLPLPCLPCQKVAKLPAAATVGAIPPPPKKQRQKFRHNCQLATSCEMKRTTATLRSLWQQLASCRSLSCC
jgi:hypothetical protein